MMAKRNKVQGWDGGQGYDESANRDPLVHIQHNSNCTPGLSTRKSLPTRTWGGGNGSGTGRGAMDVGDPRKDATYVVPNQHPNDYLDAGDNRGK